jgi:acyl-[acyl carrier protein]--UDP-N-acetylglucosamine O-acyltransferase
VDKDVLPFSKAMGDPLRYAGVNSLGLTRAGFGEIDSAALQGFYRGFTESGKAEALAALPALGAGLAAILADFLGKQKRGLLTRPL